MKTRLQIPIPPRTRRSHAERRAETRRKVLDAVVESIAEFGYQKTSSAEIAQRSGVTWGGIQHHFGDKNGILIAVLEDSYNRFAERLAEGPAPGADLPRRVDLFVELCWQHFSSPHYRCTFEILLNLPPDFDPSWQNSMLESWTALWSKYFPESDPASSRTADLMHYTISLLSGLAMGRMLGDRGTAASKRELGILKDTLCRAFA